MLEIDAVPLKMQFLALKARRDNRLRGFRRALVKGTPRILPLTWSRVLNLVERARVVAGGYRRKLSGNGVGSLHNFSVMLPRA